MRAKYIIVLLILAIFTLALISGGLAGRQSLVEVSDNPSADAATEPPDYTAQTTADAPAPQAISVASTPPIKRPDLTLNAQGKLHTHSQNDEHISLPAALAADIERRRIPQSQLVLTPNLAGGYSMDAKGQYHTVVVAFIDEQGQLRTEERIVYPLAGQPAPSLQAPQAPVSPATTKAAKP